MSESLSISGTKYIPAAQAGKRFGYTKEYILLLAREGKIDAQRVGRRWYVEPVSVDTFFKRAHEVRKVRNDSIRKVRKAELANHEFTRHAGHHKTALIQTLAILVIGLAIGTTGYLGTNVAQPALVQEASASFFERLAVALYTFVVPESQQETETQLTAAPSATATDNQEAQQITASSTSNQEQEALTAATFSSLVVAPEVVMSSTTVDSIRDSFSDEVTITMDDANPDTGVIVPRFKTRDGEAYRYLLVPVRSGNDGASAAVEVSDPPLGG